VRGFKVIALGEAISVNSTTAAEPESVSTQSIDAVLATFDGTPPGLILIGESQRSLAEVSQAFTNPDGALQFLQDWGWQENAYREFAPPNGEPLSPFDLDYARVGIHRFGGVSQSATAADYIAQDIVAGIGGGGGPGPAIGDGSILLSGQNENGNWVNMIVYQGPYVISVSASSPRGDPSGATLAMADAVLANVDQSSSGGRPFNPAGLSPQWRRPGAGGGREPPRSRQDLVGKSR
jgi:hypothetical protein